MLMSTEPGRGALKLSSYNLNVYVVYSIYYIYIKMKFAHEAGRTNNKIEQYEYFEYIGHTQNISTFKYL